MATATGDSEKLVSEIARLLYKFEVDEESVRESGRKIKEGQDEQNRVVGEARLLEREQFEASIDIKAEKQQRHFEDMEGAIRRHWATRLELAARGSEEEVRIMERRDSDLSRLSQMRAQFEASEQAREEATGGAVAAGGLGFGAGRMGGILRAVGWGGIAGMASMAGVAALMAQSVAQWREARVGARGFSEGAGMDPEFMFGLMPTFQSMRRDLGMSPEGIGRIAGSFLPIAQGGFGGGTQIGELTEEAALLGRARGIDPSTIARMMTQFRLLEGTDLPKLRDKITDVINDAERAGVPAGMWIDNLTRMVDAGRPYNRAIEESTVLLGLFSREVQQGLVTVQQLIAVQEGAARAPGGLQALVGARMLAAGGEVGQMLTTAGATDPFFAAFAIKSTLQGGLVTAEGVAVPSNKTEEALVESRKAAIRQEMGAFLEEMGAGAAGEESTGLQRRAMQSLFFRQYGLIPEGGAEMTTEILIDAFMGRRQPTAGGLAGGEGAKTAEEFLKIGHESMRDSLSYIKKFSLAVGDITDKMVLAQDYRIARMLGDDRKAELIKRQLESLGPSVLEEAETSVLDQMTYPRQQGSAYPTGGMPNWLFDLFNRPVKIEVLNSTGQDLEFRQLEDNPEGTESHNPQRGRGYMGRNY